MIQIMSRNVDGCRVKFEFETEGELLSDWNSDEPSMGDNEVLLVIQDDKVVYSSLGRKVTGYEDTVRTSDVIDWFKP